MALLDWLKRKKQSRNHRKRYYCQTLFFKHGQQMTDQGYSDYSQTFKIIGGKVDIKKIKTLHRGENPNEFWELLQISSKTRTSLVKLIHKDYELDRKEEIFVRLFRNYKRKPKTRKFYDIN